MTILEWQGEIGWELWLPELKAQLKASKGDDLTIRFSSIGGSIFEGSDIFNMLADHRRDNPKAKMNLEIKGMALSMGSAIAASPVWDDISIEQTSMVMLHNPWTLAIGDFDEMQSSADFLKSARDMFAKIYAARSKQSIDEIITAMSAETWFFGQEIIDAGFADRMNETVSSADPQDKVITLAAMKVKFAEMKKHQRELNEGEKFDEKRAVACLRTSIKSTVISADEKTDIENLLTKYLDKFNEQQETESKIKNKTEDPMDKIELMKNNPDIYDECVQDGIMIERDRVKTLTAMKTQDNYKNIPEVVAAIDKAILEGKNTDETQTMMNAAMVTIMNDPAKARAAALESPGDIQGGNEQNTVMQTAKIREV